MKNCGRKFHQELGKFRFLNELIRMISPKVKKLMIENFTCVLLDFIYRWPTLLPVLLLKAQNILFYLNVLNQYLGKEIPVKVQEKIKSMMYSWKIGLPSEPKIAEAYEMLKKQGNG